VPRIAATSAAALRRVLGLFGIGIAVVEQSRASADLGDAVLHPHRAQGQARVHVAVKGDAADRAAIPAARRALLCLDKRIAHSFGAPVTVTAQAWRETRRARRIPGELALDVVDRVDQARIHLDLAAGR
jgi:hypothetical protein